MIRLMLAAALAVPTPAAAACLSAPEAEAVALVALPEVIRQTGTVCAARLPANALVRQGSGPLLDRYDREAERAWPAARGAIVKLSDPAVDALLGSQYARPLLLSLLVPLLVGRIAPDDCATIDRIVTEVAPLPPRNVAALVVTALQFLKAEQAKGRSVAVPDLPLCRAGS